MDVAPTPQVTVSLCSDPKTDTTIKSCPGMTYVVDPSRKWYIPEGKASSECTYCEECYEKYVKGTDDEKLMRCKTISDSCCCDHPNRNQSTPPCPGRKPIYDPNRIWFVPNGKTTNECTYCLECFDKYIKGTSEEDNVYQAHSATPCNCDYQKDTNYCEKSGFRITVADTTGKSFETRNLDPRYDTTCVVPTCTKYFINIQTDNVYKLIDAKMGDKKLLVLLNSNPTNVVIEATEDNMVPSPLVFYSKSSHEAVNSVDENSDLELSFIKFDKDVELPVTMKIKLICTQSDDEKYKINQDYVAQIQKNRIVYLVEQKESYRELAQTYKENLDEFHNYYTEMGDDYFTKISDLQRSFMVALSVNDQENYDKYMKLVECIEKELEPHKIQN